MKSAFKFFEKNIGPPLANWSFAMMHRQVHVIQKRGVSMMHTARPFAYYRKVFFEGKTEAAVLQSLAGKRLLDIGCGYTPFANDSMFRVCHDAGIEFYGIDPLIADEFEFGLKERLMARAFGSRGMFSQAAPGLEKALPSYAHDLPFDDNSIDQILCSYLLFVWIEDEAALAEIFKEFLRVLKPGALVKIYPLHEWSQLRFSNSELIDILANFDIEQSFVHGGLDFRVTPAMLTKLRKQES